MKLNTLIATWRLRGFGLLNIPLLFFVSPTVVELNEKRSEIKISLTKRSKNHLGSMYFGALAIGADCAVGLLGLHIMEQAGEKKVHLSFKEFHADFLRRPEKHVYFICEEGEKIAAEVARLVESGARINVPLNAYAIVHHKDSVERVANFQLTLSLKRK